MFTYCLFIISRYCLRNVYFIIIKLLSQNTIILFLRLSFLGVFIEVNLNALFNGLSAFGLQEYTVEYQNPLVMATFTPHLARHNMVTM